MVNLKVLGAAALLAIAPALASSVADARPGGGGGFSRGGGGGGMAFRGGGGGGFRGGGFAARPSFGGGGFRGGNFAARPGFSGNNFGRAAVAGAGVGALSANRSWRPVAQLGGGGRQWNGNRHWHGRGWRGYGYGFGAGLALGALGSSYYYNDPYYYGDTYAYAPDAYVDDGQYAAAPASDADAAYCAQRYKSYDPASGTYLNYDGNRYPCP